VRKQKTTNQKMILIDLDGTLLNNEKQIGTKDLKTLEKLGADGVIRVFATGRTPYSASKVLNNSTPFDYLVFSSGSGIINWRTGKIIYQTLLNKIQINKTVQILRNLEVNFSIQLPIPENHKYFYYQAKKTNTDFEWRNQLYKKYATELNPTSGFNSPILASHKINSSQFIPRELAPSLLISPYPLEQATQFLVILENESEFEMVKSKITDLKVIRATSPIDGKSIWLEIFPKNVSKATGGQFLCKMLNISEQNTIGIGNDYNDIDLLKWTNKSFAVANSPEIIKNSFTVCADNENNPLTDVVEQI